MAWWNRFVRSYGLEVGGYAGKRGGDALKDGGMRFAFPPYGSFQTVLSIVWSLKGYRIMHSWVIRTFSLVAIMITTPSLADPYLHQQRVPMALVSPADSGIAAYGLHIFQTLMKNRYYPPTFSALNISAAVKIEIIVGPEGYVQAARVVQSSGNPFADQVGLINATLAWFGPFTPDMPQKPISFVIPFNLGPFSQ